ncbi:Serine protease gd [Eumeta japonica]|uniref:Serine protease gd n=1 Tax=Eumeta variegata TaxID=151549 RepID=A0A4C1VK74_EUMVA|nr:Serine protease gd [Eumeta japonica]
MSIKALLFIKLSLLLLNNVPCNSWGIVGNPLAHFHPCKGHDNIIGSFESGRPPGDENQYNIHIGEALPVNSRINIKFNADSTLTLSSPDYARVTSHHDGSFSIRFFKKGPDSGVGFKVRGPVDGVTVPYITSLVINEEEYCNETNVGVIDTLILGVRDTAEYHSPKPNAPTCGRRIIKHTELITSGSPTKPGDWPWHAAIYRYERNSLLYKCGGTLISKTLVLTAAHCTTIRGEPLLPEVINVVLGKYNLFGGDISSQEKEVFQVIVHQEYNASSLNNDVSILKLKTEALYDDYVQPACLWDPSVLNKINGQQIFGTVVGWGFDRTDKLSTQLTQAKIPMVSEVACLRSNGEFFSKFLNEYKFCAGLKNGTSACNGDSGGGFVVFVPDTADDTSPEAPGSWYVRGVVSVGVSRSDANICDPNELTLFTDLAKYRHWIQAHMN